MFGAFASAFRTPDLRKKLLFTFAMIVLYRLGASVPTPNTNITAINTCIKQASNGANANVYSLINLFSGGALLRLSVFALGIMPYITASIIIQLLVVVIPRFDQLKQRGPVRAAEADPVQPLPDDRPGHPAVHRLRRAGQVRPAVRHLHRLVGQPGAHPLQRERPGAGDDGHHHDRRHRDHHVARRTGHRPRRRQRHERADVHLDRRAHPERGQHHPADRGRLRLHADPGAGPGDHRGGRVRRAGAAPDPGAVRQAHGRPAPVRRHVHLPAVEGQPGRRHPGHLRVVAALHPAADQPADQQQHLDVVVRAVGEELPAQPAVVGLHRRRTSR